MAAIGYKAALDWLLANDDCELVDPEYLAGGEDNNLSVVGVFVADCYGKSESQVKKDLIARAKKNKKSG